MCKREKIKGKEVFLFSFSGVWIDREVSNYTSLFPYFRPLPCNQEKTQYKTSSYYNQIPNKVYQVCMLVFKPFWCFPMIGYVDMSLWRIKSHCMTKMTNCFLFFFFLNLVKLNFNSLPSIKFGISLEVERNLEVLF